MDLAPSLFLLQGNSAAEAPRHNHKRDNAARFLHATKTPAKGRGGDRVAVMPANGRSVFAIQPDQLALNPDPVRRQDADLVGGVGRL